MSECPYKNFKEKINKYIEVLREPREEYSGFPACPFVGSEVDQGKLMIEIFDPSTCSIIEMVEKLEYSEYESALFVQVTEIDIPSNSTYIYQNFLNKLLKNNGYPHLKCICFNPNDIVNIGGYSIRKHSPYFLINVANKKLLSSAHKKMLKTKYFDKMNKEYLDFLQIKENQIRRKK